MNRRLFTTNLEDVFENQFVYPNPPVGGSKSIFFTPFRVGVNEENRFRRW
jgi:hypothetical protein